MKYIAHDYQEEATAFIKKNPIAAVFLSCGLGKTVITLTAIEEMLHDSFQICRVLVMAPLRVAKLSWPDEIKKWDHLNNLTFAVAVGNESERKTAIRQNADITIINRENVQWLVEESGIKFSYDMVVIDELSSFKNRKSKRFKALMRIRPKVKRIVGLTGTPSPNGLMDLWAEFKVLDRGERLGRFIGSYRSSFFIPDKYNNKMIFSYKPKTGAEDEIYRRIGDITISMKAMDHLEMPNLISSEVKAIMSETERKDYKKLMKDFVLGLPDGEVTVANAASLSGKLCQMANGAIYTDDGNTSSIHERKLDALEDIIEAAYGKPVLLAYWFRHDLDRIKTRLKKLGIRFSCLESTQSIRDWNSGNLEVGLIHPASAGHGLNLQSGGSHLVWFGLTWSLELYQQTVARLWRQGQKSTTVVVQHIITEGTIDERILKALDSKQMVQDALLEAVKAEIKDVKKKENI
ncbi:MAG: DEAD/DEAH box helicase [Saccharofermentanales bacterium]